MRVVISTRAKADLREIARFIAKRDKVRAASFVRELQAAAHELAPRPLAYALVPHYASRGIRKRLFGSYAIFYRAEEDRVVILNIVHGARKIDAILDLSADDDAE